MKMVIEIRDVEGHRYEHLAEELQDFAKALVNPKFAGNRYRGITESGKVMPGEGVYRTTITWAIMEDDE